MLNEVSQELMRTYVEQMKGSDAIKPLDLMKEMFKEQPAFKTILKVVTASDECSEEFKDGYCKGMLQAWYLLNQQAIINDLES